MPSQSATGRARSGLSLANPWNRSPLQPSRLFGGLHSSVRLAFRRPLAAMGPRRPLSDPPVHLGLPGVTTKDHVLPPHPHASEITPYKQSVLAMRQRLKIRVERLSRSCGNPVLRSTWSLE